MKDFPRFWKQTGTNLIIGLVITLVLCVIVGLQKVWFSLPVWIAIGVVFWVLRALMLYRNWKRNAPDEEE